MKVGEARQVYEAAVAITKTEVDGEPIVLPFKSSLFLAQMTKAQEVPYEQSEKERIRLLKAHGVPTPDGNAYTFTGEAGAKFVEEYAVVLDTETATPALTWAEDMFADVKGINPAHLVPLLMFLEPKKKE